MGASQLQLEAVGIQDNYLTGNPQMTYFKSIYKRHTNFSIETLNCPFLGGDTNIDFNSELNCIIPKEGDLLGNIYLEIDIKGKASKFGHKTVDHFGNSLIREVKFFLGSEEIDKHTGQWLQIDRELNDKINEYKELSSGPNGGKNIPDFTPGKGWDSKYWSYDLNHNKLNDRTYGDSCLTFGGALSNDGNELNYGSTGGLSFDTEYTKKIYIPLKFWFNKHPGLYLPIIALKNIEIMIKIQTEELNNVRGNIETNNLSIENIKLYSDFYILDKTEKRLFEKKSHEYLIEQVQIIDTERTSSTLDTNSTTELIETTIPINTFSNPVKYLIWTINNPGQIGNNPGQGPCYFTSLCSNTQHGNDGQDGSVRLLLKNIEKFKERPMSYFTRILPNKYCKNGMPDLDRIGMYSFALEPLQIQPSGTINFSRLDKKQLKIKFANINIDTIKDKKIILFAVNYNILRIINNQGGLVFSK